jgi:hypothetical protein
MHQRKWLRAAFLLTGMAVALAAQDSVQAPAPQTYQPGQVIQVTAHHSRWDYPKEITLPEGSQLHIVETGDTLWDLGNKYLGNPFSWPQIWELNKWITDPHWIYPGDHLIVPAGNTTLLPGETPSEVVEVAPGGSRLQTKPQQDEFAFTFQDFIQLPYLVPEGAGTYFKGIGGVKITSVGRSVLPNKTQVGDFDMLYVDGGSENGLKVGDRVLAIKIIKKKLFHPLDTRESNSLGDVLKQIAVARATQIQPKASVFVIEKSADTVEPGDYLVPFTEPANMTIKLRTDTHEPIPVQTPEPRVIFITDNHGIAGTGNMIIIDKGSKDGMKVGDVLLSVRERSWPLESQGPNTMAKTNYLIAQMLVVKTMEGSATCRILRGYEETELGDFVTH